MAYHYGTDFPGSPLGGIDDAEVKRVRSIASGRPGAPTVITRGGERETYAQSRLQAHLIAERERAQSYLYPFHRQWFINISAYLGAQGIQSESIAKILKVNLKRPQHRITHQSNLVGGSVRRLVGYLARSNPELEFVPADPDDSLQVDYAIGAKDWLEFQWKYDAWKRKNLEIKNWAVTTGMGVSKATYDYKGGPRETAVEEDGTIITDEKGRPMIDANGEPLTYPTGIAHTTVVPAFHYIYGIAARTDEELGWNGEDSWLSFRYLESICEESNVVDKYRLVGEPQFTNMSGLYERQVMQTMGPSGTYSGASPESNEQGCRVTQIFIAPYYLEEKTYGRELFENGAFLMLAQGKFIGGLRPNPLMKLRGVNPRSDWNPYTIWPCYDVVGRMIPQGLPDNLIPLQEAINFTMARLRESQRLMGQPKWFIPRNSINQKIDAEAGQTITFNPTVGPPMAHAPTPMPAYVIQMLGIMEEHVDRVSSQPPMMQGKAQGQVRSGLGVQLLQEQSLTEFTPIIEKHDYCLARHTRQLLLREIQFSDSTRKITRRDGTGNWTRSLFYAKHMDPQFMIGIVPGSSMPQSKALAMSELDRMIAWGVLQPALNPAHAEVVARVMKYQIPSTSPDDTEAALSQARQENWLITERPGDEPPTLSTFNHRVHINEHIRYINSPRFLARVQDEVRKFGMSPSLSRMMTHLGKHYGHLQAIQLGVVLPQPIPPFEDMQLEVAGVPGQPGSAPGRGQGMIGGTPGAQNMTSRGMSIGTDQMANQSMHAASAPRLGGMEGIGSVEDAGSAPSAPSMQGYSGGA